MWKGCLRFVLRYVRLVKKNLCLERTVVFVSTEFGVNSKSSDRIRCTHFPPVFSWHFTKIFLPFLLRRLIRFTFFFFRCWVLVLKPDSYLYQCRMVNLILSRVYSYNISVVLYFTVYILHFGLDLASHVKSRGHQ